MRRGFHIATLMTMVVLVVLAGCSGGGNRTPEPIEANASQATVAGGTLQETGFAEDRVEQVRVNRSGTLSIAGDVEMDLGYRVNATGWRASYRSSGSDPPTVFALYTVPLAKPERVDATIDPLGDRSLSTVVDESQRTYGSVEGLEHVRNRTVTVLGKQATVRQYAGTATADGGANDVTVHVAVVEHESDVIRAIAVAPRDADAWSTVRPLFEAIDH